MASHRAAADRLVNVPALVALLALACTALAVLAASPALAASGTYVRLAQLTPDNAGADLVLSSVSDPKRSVTIPGVGYGALSDYRLVQPGDYAVAIMPKDSSATTTVNINLNAMAGASYTLAAVGRAGEQTGLSVLTDDLTPPATGSAKLRVISGAPSAPALDVRGPGGDIALGLPYAEASSYRDVPAGASTLTVGPPGGATVNVPITVAPNQVASVVLVDRGGSLAAEVTVDADGPSQVPPGAIKAGFGGAAPGQPTEQAGVLTFGVLAVAAAGLAAFLSRRGRGARQQS